MRGFAVFPEDICGFAPGQLVVGDEHGFHGVNHGLNNQRGGGDGVDAIAGEAAVAALAGDPVFLLGGRRANPALDWFPEHPETIRLAGSDQPAWVNRPRE